MKKLLILILAAAAFAAAENCKTFNGVVFCENDNGHWNEISGSYESYDLSKFDYDIDEGNIKFWRQDGTLIFEGKVNITVQEIGKPTVMLDGFCFDKTGMNKIKRTTKISACK